MILVRGIRDAESAETVICSEVADSAAGCRPLIRDFDMIERLHEGASGRSQTHVGDILWARLDRFLDSPQRLG